MPLAKTGELGGRAPVTGAFDFIHVEIYGIGSAKETLNEKMTRIKDI